MLKFEISAEEYERINAWLVGTVYPEVIAKQKLTGMADNPVAQSCWEEGFPYSGVSGGGLSYEFIPTGLGTVTIARYVGGYELDFTDYSNW